MIKKLFYSLLVTFIITSSGNATDKDSFSNLNENSNFKKPSPTSSLQEIKKVVEMFRDEKSNSTEAFHMLENIGRHATDPKAFTKNVREALEIKENLEKEDINVNIGHIPNEKELIESEQAAQKILATLNNDSAKINQEAQNDYYGWEGVTQDKLLSFKLFKASARLGNPVGLYNVGIFYDSGTWIPQDKKKAVAYYKKAADKGHEASLYPLVNHYLKKEMYKEAYHYLEMWASNFQDKVAYRRLAHLHKEGLGVEKDAQKALLYYQKAADKGDTESLHILVDDYLSQKMHKEAFLCLARWLSKFKDERVYHKFMQLHKKGLGENHESAYNLANRYEKEIPHFKKIALEAQKFSVLEGLKDLEGLDISEVSEALEPLKVLRTLDALEALFLSHVFLKNQTQTLPNLVAAQTYYNWWNSLKEAKKMSFLTPPHPI